MSTVSVVIPNYNGQELLAKHLPAVIKSMRTGDELVVIDDCSTDDSWSWLQKEFRTKETSKDSFVGEVSSGKWSLSSKSGTVLLLRSKKNLRFGMSCNAAVEQATHPLIYLINTDVSPHAQTISVLEKHFEDPTVFAVGCLEHEKSVGGRDIFGGKNVLNFGRGMFAHQRAAEFSTGETAWASGGSSMFDKQKWLELGGFDPDYYPAYWEDVDLSFRAKKHGWKVLFDQDAEVDHNHESTNTTAFGQKKMEKMSWQHAQTFVSKNATWKQKVQYILWQPYWWIKGPTIASLQLQVIFLALIILAATLLRFNKLAEVPHGMTWDEAAIAYNGWSVATTGRDEWLKKLPISFRSFGDYKAPLAIYIVGAFTRFMGMTLLAVRLPFALSGVAAVIGMMLLTKLMWEEWVPRKVPTKFPQLTSNTASLLVGALMATSAWHVHFSRIGFESGMALNFLLWGVLGIFWLLTRKSAPHTLKFTVRDVAVGVFSAGMIAASLYTYHSSKVVLPLVLGLIVLLFVKKIRRSWKSSLLWLSLVAAMLVPLLYDSVFGNGADRFRQSSVFRLGLSPVGLIQTLVSHFFSHFSPAYLVNGATETLRHGDGKFGVLYFSEFFLVVIGFFGFLYQAINKNKALIKRVPTLFWFSIVWIVIGVLPAAIGVDVPHSNRMLLALPGFMWMAALGWEWVAENFAEGLIAPAVLGVTALMQIFLACSYLNHYYTDFAKASADDFIDGYQQAIEYVVQHEDEVDNVIFTSAYQQPYIYVLIGKKSNTYEYHNGALIKYLFSDKITDGDTFRVKAMIVATPDQVDPRAADKLIYGSDGKVKFVIVKTK